MSSRKKTLTSVARTSSASKKKVKLGTNPTHAREHLEAYAEDLANAGSDHFGEGAKLIARAAEFRQLARIATDEQALSIRDQLYDAKELVVVTSSGGDA